MSNPTNQSNNLLKTAVEWYTEHGFTLFPLNGKYPPKNFHWRDTEYNPFASVADFPSGNFGIVLRSNDLVIDVDPRNFVKEKNTLDIFLKLAATDLPETTYVKTGSGGIHLYYKKPSNILIRKVLKEFPGLDFLSDGCYVVGAGSIHPKTRQPYQGYFKPITDAPAQLLELIKKQKTETYTHGTDNYDSSQQTLDRYVEYLGHAPVAVEGHGGDQTTFSVAAVGHDFGLPPDKTWELLCTHYNNRCEPPWLADELKKKVYNAYKYVADSIGNKSPVTQFKKIEISQIDPLLKLFHRDAHGQLKKDLHNTTLFFGIDMPLDNLLAYNEFSKEIVFLKSAPWHHNFEHIRIWTDGEVLRAKFWISQAFKFEPPTTIMYEAAYVAAAMRPFHPVKDYLSTLSWDGHNRIHKWLTGYLGAADDEYTRAVGIKFLVAAVKRIYEPGCKFDYILVLEGGQGTFKSTVFEILASREWYCDPSADITNKDIVGMLFGKWIIELPEMETHRRTETRAMKAFLSRNTDRCRMPYGRITVDFPRQCVFGGTINPERDEDIGWLKDSTGNRRYWPVRIGLTKSPDLGDLKTIRNQLWAEAKHLYDQKMAIYLDDFKIVEMARKEQNARMGRDIWTETIERYLTVMAIDKQTVSAGEIYRDALGGNILHCGKREHTRIASIMELLEWDKGVFYNPNNKKTERGYRRPVLIVKEVLE